ncbi:MAG: hypothetical protein ACYDAD_03405, partial [Acidimicrobiales bacterium]
MARLVALVLTAAFALSASACGAGHLVFVADHRFHFTTPRDRSLVTAPITVRWTMSGFEPRGLDGQRRHDAGAFAVFVDTNPMPVGRGLRWVAHGDKACKVDPACPSPSYLANRNVYVTTARELHLDVWPATR